MAKNIVVVRVIWGTEAVNKHENKSEKQILKLKAKGDIRDYMFYTQAEANAFIWGIDESNGWQDYITLIKPQEDGKDS